jgi:hypothetical protein
MNGITTACRTNRCRCAGRASAQGGDPVVV